MKHKFLLLTVLVVLSGTALVIFFATPALAQDQQTGSSQPSGVTKPTPTPATPAKLKPPSAQSPEAVSGVDYGAPTLNARGTHPGEHSRYSLVIANQGSTTGAATEAEIRIPTNTTYVAGSAQVQGGGTLNVTRDSVHWAGSIVNGTSITITFEVVLPGVVGTEVDATGTIVDPGLAASIPLKSILKVQAPNGGPDGFGYTYLDTLAPGSPVTFNWIAPASITPTVNLGAYPHDDEVSAALPIGFPFRFYKNTYSDLYVNSNGLVMFGPKNATNVSNVPEPIPNPGSTNNYASCLWTDLFMRQSPQGIWIETHGSAPDRYTVITFQAAYFLDETATPDLFQMILYETSNQIKCQYAHTSGPYYGSGGQAQIGMENSDGSAGLSYFFHQNINEVMIGPLEDNLAILFTPGPAALPVFVTSDLGVSANVHPGDTATYTLHVRNSGTGPGSLTTVTDPIPAGTTYVTGSAAVQGGGTLDATAAHVNWSGTIVPSATVTITYRVQLPTILGSVIENSATIADPQAAVPVTLVNRDLRVLPSPTGGPDAFGYAYEDTYSGGSVTFSWVPTTTATKINFGVLPADDVFTGTIPIGFPFHFYSQTVNDFYVSSNGLVSFGAGYDSNTNAPIPTPGGVTNYASCFWSDLYIKNASQGVWVQTIGAAPDRYAVITFQTTYFIDSNTPPALFQMILYETSNRIKCQYADTRGTILGSGGGGATVGLENADGTSGIQYFFLPAYTTPILHGPLENNLAVLFTPGGQVPAFSASTKSVSKQMHPGETLAYTVGIQNNADTPSTVSTLSDPIPAGTTYVPGSAHVVGGGLLNPTASNIGWQGTVAASHSVTVTFDVVLNAPFGPVTNTATINDPAAAIPIERSALTPVQPPIGFGVGSPGYFYKDSYAPGVTFSWVPTTTNSISLTITQGNYDDGYGSYPLGFTFPFFGHGYSTVQVSTNGLVMFNDTGSAVPVNQPILTPGTVDNFATCFWDDQVIKYPGQAIWLETFGSAPDRYAVITFVLQDMAAPGPMPYRYQMILYEHGGAIKCQYEHMSAFVNGDGRSATIGLEDRFGTSGVQYFYNRLQPPFIGPVEDGLAIEFNVFGRVYLPIMKK